MPKKLTKEIFIEKARKKHKNFYSYEKVNYVNALTNVTITCPVHGDFEQTPNNHLSGRGCKYCANEAQVADASAKFIPEAREKHKDFYSYKNAKYINTYTKVTITCPVHGDFDQTPSNHLSGQGCKYCANEAQVADASAKFIPEAREKHKGFYSYEKVIYVNNRTKVTITCPVHGDFDQEPSSHLRGYGCPDCNCNESKGEKRMRHYFKDNAYLIISQHKFKNHEDKRRVMGNVYISQYHFSDCKYKKPLPFDGFLPKYNLCIEFQGEQHYKIRFWVNIIKNRTKYKLKPLSEKELIKQAEEKLKFQQMKDRIKKQYCKKNNINYLVIPYWDIDNIENIIKEKIESIKLNQYKKAA
jgi:hypothetical protein